MAERLQKFLARAGVASRRRAEQLIAEGRGTVNEQTVARMGTQIDPALDRVKVDGREVHLPDASGYFVLYKPAGVVTTLSDPQGRATISDWVREMPGRLFPVGRLDYDAEGGLITHDDWSLAPNQAAVRRRGISGLATVPPKLRGRGCIGDEAGRAAPVAAGGSRAARVSVGRQAGRGSRGAVSAPAPAPSGGASGGIEGQISS